jgi:hypothetical protein
MRNCNDILKRAAVPSISTGMNPEKLLLDKGQNAKNTEDWFNDNFRSIILRNMGIEEDGIQDRE